MVVGVGVNGDDGDDGDVNGDDTLALERAVS